VGAFRSWLFGLGDHAEVLGPPEVRADIVAWLEHMAGAA
jgi:proteasome accessory factor B